MPAGLTDVRDISAGHAHCLALKNNGTIAAWGCNVFDQTKIPLRLAGVKSIGELEGRDSLIANDPSLAIPPKQVVKLVT